MVDKSRIKKSKSKNKTSKIKQKNLNTIWGIYGKVFNAKTNKYIRIGNSESMKVISNLKRDYEWKKRVNYIISHHKPFGEKLKNYLEKNK